MLPRQIFAMLHGVLDGMRVVARVEGAKATLVWLETHANATVPTRSQRLVPAVKAPVRVALPCGTLL
jgi:hypothetical protein